MKRIWGAWVPGSGSELRPVVSLEGRCEILQQAGSVFLKLIRGLKTRTRVIRDIYIYDT